MRGIGDMARKEILRGWRSPSSRYMQTKNEIERVERQIEKRKETLAALPDELENARAPKGAIADRLRAGTTASLMRKNPKHWSRHG